MTLSRPSGRRVHRRPVQRLASALALLGLSACGGGDGLIIQRVPQCTITGVVVTPSTTTLSIGESTPLQSLPSSQNCTSIPATTWTSASPSVATVGATSGLVTAVTPGTAVITASIGSANGSAVVTVRVPPVATIFIAPPSALQVGQSVTLLAEPRDARGVALTGRAVTWQSAAPSIATVTANGLVTGVAPGTTTITATSEGINQDVSVTVTSRPPATIELTVPNPTLLAMQTTQATFIVRDAVGGALANETVTWVSTNAAVAIVSSTGLITGVAPGQATVRAVSNSVPSVSASAVITVNSGAPASVVVNLDATLNLTQVATATATVRDAAQNIITNANVTWTSSNPAIASVVSTTGVVSAVAAGTTTITATVVGFPAVSGSKALAIAAPVTTVTLTQSNVLLEPGPQAGLTSLQLNVTLRNAGGNVVTGRTITYTSSNTAAATVNATGLVSAVAVGTGTITATSEGVSTSIPLIVARAFAVVEANLPSNPNTYQPPQINSAGSPINVTRTGTGQYRIVFAGLGAASTTIGRSFTFLVNATNSTINAQLNTPTALCNAYVFDVTGPTILAVLCVDPATLAPKDAAFRAMIIGDNFIGSAGTAAFSLHDKYFNPPYAPNPLFSWNSAGAAMTVTPGFEGAAWNGTQTRHSTGFAFGSQHGLVSTYSDRPGVSCILQGQIPASLFTDVVCFDRTGPINTVHKVLKLSAGRPGQNSGLAFVDAGSGANTGQGFNSSGGTVVSARTGVGKYTVVFGGMVASGPIGVMVTPWGASGYSACSHYLASSNPVTVDVSCFNSQGAFMNAGSAFTVLVLQ